MNKEFKNFDLKVLAEGGLIQYGKDFLSVEESNKLFNYLLSNVKWTQHYYKDFVTGEPRPTPRLTAWYADDLNMSYSYSGIKENVLPWIPELILIKNEIEKYTGHSYNSVLLNYYRNGNDSVGFHADDEKELGLNATIASLSLGDTRKFVLKQYKASKGNIINSKEVSFELTNGSILVMSGTTQHYWKHSIPKTKYSQPRINLTFRSFNV